MPPIIEINKIIAQRLWHIPLVTEILQDGSVKCFPNYCENDEDAHSIVTLFKNRGWNFKLRALPEDENFRGCFYKDDGRRYGFVTADTVPMVICQAALAALDGRNIIIEDKEI